MKTPKDFARKKDFTLSDGRGVVMISYRGLPCSLHTFKIGDKDVDVEDFGDTVDRDKYADDRPDYGCANKQFEPHDPVPYDSLAKNYGLSEADVDKILDALDDVLYVGRCGWCS